MKKIILILLIFVLGSCAQNTNEEIEEVKETESPKEEQTMPEEALRLYIDETEINVDWEKNDSVEALKKLVPLTINMSMYGGFEQVGDIGETLPRDDIQMTTEYGDIVLYSGNQMVVFYGSNDWAYTKLGKMKDLTKEDLTKLLGEHDVTIQIAIK